MFLNEEIFVPLYKSLVRSHFDYGMSVWTPHLVKYIKAIESVQRRATKMIPTIKDLSYSERFKKLKLPTLAYRRARGDMIEVYKIVIDIYDPKTTNNLFKKWLRPLASQYLLLVLCNVQAYIKMLLRVTC